MENPTCNYYIYTYQKDTTSRSGRRRIFNKLFNAHSAIEALLFNIDFVKQCGYPHDELTYEVIRKGTRRIAKERGVTTPYAVCAAVVTPWQWKSDDSLEGISRHLNAIDSEWDKAEGKYPIRRVNFFALI